MQVPLARIIELINNVAQRGMAVIKEPRLCVKIPSGVWVVGVQGGQSSLRSSRRHASLSFTARGGQANITRCIQANRKVHVEDMQKII